MNQYFHKGWFRLFYLKRLSAKTSLLSGLVLTALIYAFISFSDIGSANQIIPTYFQDLEDSITLLHEKDLKDFNLLLISLDTLRQDHLGSYGMAAPVSPFLDSLSQRSYVWTDTVAQCPSTLNSHRAIFTSQYLCRHSFGNPEIQETIAGNFKANGWRTGGFVDGGLMNKRYGHSVGFNHYDDCGGEFPNIVSRTFNWILENRKQKFFAFLHTYAIHFPYAPPEPFDRIFSENDKPWQRKGFKVKDLVPENYAAVRSSYKGGVRYADSVVAEVFKYLWDAGLDNNTVVVVLSDHGESLGDRQYVGHNRLYDDQLRVPVMIYIPGTPGGLVSGPLETIDLMPTLLSLFDIRGPDSMQGFDLKTFLTGVIRIPQDRTRLSENSDKAIRQGCDWKLIVRDRAENDECYMLDCDPKENQNVIYEFPDILDECQLLYCDLTELDLEKSRTKDYDFKIKISCADKNIVKKDKVCQLDDLTLQAQLQALGYCWNNPDNPL